MVQKEYVQQLRAEAALDEIQRAEDRASISASLEALEEDDFITMEEMAERLEASSKKRENASI